MSGESETIMQTVSRTQMIKSYFSAACAIDVHNHLRQDGLGLEHCANQRLVVSYVLHYTGHNQGRCIQSFLFI